MGWRTGWTYAKSITMSHASGTITNFQKKLLIGESDGATGKDISCSGHIKTDFSDLRFTAADGTTLLPYWIERITGASPNQLAIVWVKFNSIGTGDTTFYMYYGNAGATTAVSGTNTFDFWEDWDIIDTGIWTVNAVGGTVTAASSVCSINNTTGGSPSIGATNSHWSCPIVVEWKYKRPSFFRNRVHMGETPSFDWGDFSSTFYYNGFTGVSFTNDVYYIYQTIHLTNNFALNIYAEDYGTALLANSSAVTWAQDGKWNMSGTESSDSDPQCDWVRSRQYQATDASISGYGAEGTRPTRDWYPFPAIPFLE